jgi:hypothetical protein
MAAASNSGNLASTPYPANNHRVFAINAADGFGNKLDFNHGPRETSLNFSILGLDIISTWPAFTNIQPESKRNKRTKGSSTRKDPQTDEDLGTWKCLSGTSMATPMAAVLAALLFQFLRSKLPSSPETGTKQYQLECDANLKITFKTMACRIQGFENLVPWDGEGAKFRQCTDVEYMIRTLKDLLDIRE